MADISHLDDFFEKLFLYVTGNQASSYKLNIFRRHNNKLNTCGDFSFPLNISAWTKYLDRQPSDDLPIVNYAKMFNDNKINSCDFSDLIKESTDWCISIVKCTIENNKKLNIFLDRPGTFNIIVKLILLHAEKYGCQKVSFTSSFEIRKENESTELSCMDLTQLRINLLKDVTMNLLNTCGCEVDKTINSEVIYLTNKSENNFEGKKIVCGVVTGNKFGKKNNSISAEEFYTQRTVDMRLMAQHKYGVRINSEPGWADFFIQLGNAAVIVDLMHVKPNRTLVINIDNPISSHSKGASFILYNCARLATIFQKFYQKIALNIYPSLPDIDDVDFSLLNQPEEWEMLYVYLMRYPQIVKSCIEDISECKLNIQYLCSFLDSLCSLFSVYYRRVRILTEPRTHLFPVLYSRIYLLLAIQQVLHNALALLNIPPVKQM